MFIRSASKNFPTPPKWHVQSDKRQTKCGQEIMFDIEKQEASPPKDELCLKCK